MKNISKLISAAVFIGLSMSSSYGMERPRQEDLDSQLLDAYRNPKELKRLIRAGANVNASDILRPLTVLMLAASENRIDSIRAIVSELKVFSWLGARWFLSSFGIVKPADFYVKKCLNYCSGFELTALCQAAKYGHTECIKELVILGADINLLLPLCTVIKSHEISDEKKIECIQLLTQLGADIDDRVLDSAIKEKNEELLMLLKQIKREYERPKIKAELLVFAQASNDRLGEESPASLIDENIRKCVGEFLTNSDAK